jgi:hypothetical protein
MEMATTPLWLLIVRSNNRLAFFTASWAVPTCTPRINGLYVDSDEFGFVFHEFE